jgi:hypothetical protein
VYRSLIEEEDEAEEDDFGWRGAGGAAGGTPALRLVGLDGSVPVKPATIPSFSGVCSTQPMHRKRKHRQIDAKNTRT